MYGSSSRPFKVGELFDRLCRAAGDRCGAAVAHGARQLQLTAACAGGAGAAGDGGAGAAGTAPRRPYFYPQLHSSLPPPDSVLRQVLSLPSSTGLTPPLLCPPINQSQPQLLRGSPLPAPAPHKRGRSKRVQHQCFVKAREQLQWRIMLMELLFNHYGLLEVMDGELKRPASEGVTKEWDRRSKDGFFLLSQCLSSNQLHHVKHLIKDIQCGPKAWKILKDVHAPSSEAMVVVLERQLHAVKFNEGDAVQGAFDQLRDLYVKLSAAGVDYPEMIKCHNALSMLPKLWGPLVVNLNGMKDSWSLKPCQPSIEGSKGVHGAMGEGMGCAEGDGGTAGHGRMFYHVGEACSEDMVVPASKVALHRSSHWVIDMGAFMTMTNREDLLDEVRPSKAATVVSATGQVVLVRGEGRAMFMGADGMLVGLKCVLLVPGLCANLLSTKALSEAGMKMEMMGTKVFKATLDGRVLWDLQGGKDMHRSMWEILVCNGRRRLRTWLLIKGEPKEVPIEKWSGKKPLVDMLRVFGCMGLVHVPKEKHDKLQAAVVWAVHLGLARGSKGWLMWDPKSNTIFTTRDAKFMEGLMLKEWSERGRSKVTIPLGIEVGTNNPLLIPIELSSSSELTEVSHDLGGAEGEAADVEGTLQQG
ncbi:unnamed protein product [Closterium sp. NIES-54]